MTVMKSYTKEELESLSKEPKGDGYKLLMQPVYNEWEGTFIYIPENYPGPIAIDMKPSKECDEYHKNGRIQILMNINLNIASSDN